MAEIPDNVTATAIVATDAAARYAKQLASHLGRHGEIRDEPEGTRIVGGSGDCLLVVRKDALELRATASDRPNLDTLTEVVGRHLERFGQRRELRVEWRVTTDRKETT